MCKGLVSNASWDSKPCCIYVVRQCLPWVFLFVNVIAMVDGVFRHRC